MIIKRSPTCSARIISEFILRYNALVSGKCFMKSLVADSTYCKKKKQKKPLILVQNDKTLKFYTMTFNDIDVKYI